MGSSNVKVYYDVANSNQMGYDIYEEIRWLGKNQICEFHAKENGFLLDQGKIDFTRVRQCINDIEYTGWLQIEGTVPERKEIPESYQQNIRFMRSVFPESRS